MSTRPVRCGALCCLYVVEILRDRSIDCFASCRIWFRIRLDFFSKNSHLDVPGVQGLTGRGTNGLPLSLTFLPPDEIEALTLAASWLSIDEHEPWIRLSILPHYSNELPAAVKSAILFEVDLFMTIPAVHIRLAPSVFEWADVRNFMKMISEGHQSL